MEDAMTETITAVYEHGVLRPLTPLHLPEHSRVEIEVRTIHNHLDAHDLREQVRAALDAAGILAPVNPLTSSPLSEVDRTTLAEQLIVPGATPLSQLIIEDRGE
jgi:predicted DNA-binding antitoxin AbrB/MazE fold protein